MWQVALTTWPERIPSWITIGCRPRGSGHIREDHGVKGSDLLGEALRSHSLGM